MFRKEAVEARRQRLLGDIVLTQPLAFSVITTFLSSIVIFIVAFIADNSYARKETVKGVLVPNAGIVKIHAPRNGVIGQVFVTEGKRVESGTPLLTIIGETISGSGTAVDVELLNSVNTQLERLREQMDLAHERSAIENARLSTELIGLETERGAVDGQLAVRQQIIASQQETYDLISAMVDDGYVRKLDLIARQEELLNSRQLLASLRQNHAEISTRISRAETAIERLPFDYQEKLSQLEMASTELTMRRLDLAGRQSITLTATVAGKVSGLQATSGSSVDMRLPLLSVLPDDSQLEAHLFVPTRAIGFLEVGQDVRLMYDSFDYRRFGIQHGIVSDISSVVFAPYEALTSIQISEPSYRVIVRISEQSIAAYGRRMSLQAGTQVSADIVLQRRSIVSWLLDPFLSLKGRT